MIGDFLRYWWESLYWNFRKSRYVWAGRRGPAPCQHPSDSGRGGVTACVACQPWQRAARFRRVCPLLVQREGEWRCSVDAAQVRPFWGRAVLTWLATLLGIWTVVTLVAFGIFRAVGFEEIRYADFWSPQFRARYHAAQGAYYSAAAQRSFAEGDFPRGVLSLSIAYARSPRRWEDGLLLGQLLARTRQYQASNRTFQSLIDGFPERAEEFSTVWCDSLLLRGESELLVQLALQRLATGTPTPAPWWHVIVHAIRRETDAARATRLLQLVSASPVPRAREIAAVETALRSHSALPVDPNLASRSRARDASEALYRCETLIAAGRFEDAEMQRSLHAAMLGEFHAGLLGVTLAVHRGQDSLADLAFENLLLREMHPAKLDLLLAELLRHPSSSRARALFDRWPKEVTRADLLTARRLVALVCGVDEAGRLAPTRANDRSEEIVRELAGVLRPGVVRPPIRTRQGLLGALALTREVTLVVLE